jgi:3-deoxy-D-manno-octulosonate 8-phosphate phosphatase (KDO 8-P phosphatase)
MSENFKSRLHQVKAFFFDVDGVLTDSSLLVMENGDLLRTMNIRDGYAMKLAVEKGYHVSIISGGHSQGVALRLKKLGIKDVFISVPDKKIIFEKLVAQYHLRPEEIIYMGDDMPDLEVMQMAGIAACPADAAHQIRSKCIYVSSQTGGKGCVRDIIEQVMVLHGKWE